MPTTDFHLLDGEQRHREIPRSFVLPERSERENLPAGTLVELIFEGPDSPQGAIGERLWAEIVRSEDGRYVGRLDNDPEIVEGLHYNDEVEFGPEHVISIYDEAPVSPVLAQSMILSRRSHEQNQRPIYVVLDEPMGPDDSGWMAFLGDEAGEEIEDPANLLTQNVGWVLERWPELTGPLLTDPPHPEWIWDDEARQYVPVPEDADEAAAVEKAAGLTS